MVYFIHQKDLETKGRSWPKILDGTHTTHGLMVTGNYHSNQLTNYNRIEVDYEQ